MEPLIGILPAGGLGSRLLPFAYPKELLPVFYRRNGPNRAEPILVIEHALEAMSVAGIERCLVVIGPHKSAVLSYLADGRRFGVSTAYVYQAEPLGLAHAAVEAARWAPNATTCLALPDTVFEPLDALAQVRKVFASRAADVALGIFPTKTPERFAPVRLDARGRVHEVTEKPPEPGALDNTWGVAVWSPRFTSLLRDFLAERPAEENSLSHAFQAAVDSELTVVGTTFPNGRYWDLGTPEGIGSLLTTGGWRP